jgi:hypothetical protein
MLKGEREENDVLLELVKLLLVQLSVKCLTETLAARGDIVCFVLFSSWGFSFVDTGDAVFEALLW